jgi:cytochrome c556
MTLKHLIAATGVLATLSVGAAVADNQSDNPFAAEIKARQAQMQIYAFNLGILGGMAKGKTEYNADAATQAASNIVNASAIHQPQAWAMGSDNASVSGTKALPALWENFPDAGAKSAELAAAALAMQAVAGEGHAAIGGAMGRLGAACSACHKAYRGQ